MQDGTWPYCIIISKLTTPIPKLEQCITNEDNPAIIQIPLEEEIKNVVWAMPNHKNPGPDGFGPSFYRASWETIKNDLVQNIQKISSKANSLQIGMIPI